MCCCCNLAAFSSHFVLEVSEEMFDVLTSYVASSDQPVLQYLLNTTLEINIIRVKIDAITTPIPGPKPNASLHYIYINIEEHKGNFVYCRSLLTP